MRVTWLLALVLVPGAQACHSSWPELDVDGLDCDADCPAVPTAGAPFVLDTSVRWSWAPVNDCPENAIVGDVRIIPDVARSFPDWLAVAFEPQEIVIAQGERAAADLQVTGNAMAPLAEVHERPIRITVERSGDPAPQQADGNGTEVLRTFLRFQSYGDQRQQDAFAVLELTFDSSDEAALQPRRADPGPAEMPSFTAGSLFAVIGLALAMRRTHKT